MKRIDFFTVKLVKEKASLYNLESKVIRDPESAFEFAKEVLKLDEEPVEKFGILTLSTKNNVIGVHIINVGGLNASTVSCRAIFQNTILNNAASIICFHNHPSGDPTPSREDIAITKRIKEGGKLLEIDVLDHIIIGHDNQFYSLKEKGHC